MSDNNEPRRVGEWESFTPENTADIERQIPLEEHTSLGERILELLERDESTDTEKLLSLASILDLFLIEANSGDLNLFMTNSELCTFRSLMGSINKGSFTYMYSLIIKGKSND